MINYVQAGAPLLYPPGDMRGLLAQAIQDVAGSAGIKGIFTPEQYGAVGDGVTDDYAALQALVAAVNTNGGGVVEFTRGRTYRIDRYKIWGGPEANGVTDLIFSGCNALTINGNGSKIDIKGDFYRSWDYTSGEFHYSYRASVGLILSQCQNITVRHLEIDANGDLTTKDTANAVAEGPCYGLQFSACSQFYVENVYAHHVTTDCFNIREGGAGPAYTICKRGTFINCRADYAGRQGMSITGARWLLFQNCHFTNTGRSAYGAHSPGAGVDVEVNRSAANGTLDDYCGDILFLGCYFKNNAGSELTAGGTDGSTPHPVNCYGCHFEGAGVADDSRIIAATGVNIFRDCYFSGLEFKPQWSVSRDVRCLVDGCVFRIATPDTSIIRWVLDKGELVIRNSLISCEGTQPVTSTFRIYIRASGTAKMEFKHNRIWLAGAEFNPHNGVSPYDFPVSLEGGYVEGNRYATDLDTSGGNFYSIDYALSRVQSEVFETAGAFSHSTEPPAATGDEVYEPYDRQEAASASTGTITPNLDQSRTAVVVMGAGTPAALTVAPPYVSGKNLLWVGRRLGFRVIQTAAVAHTYAWDAIYKLTTTFSTGPANGFSKHIEFEWNGTNWVEVSCSPDIPN